MIKCYVAEIEDGLESGICLETTSTCILTKLFISIITKTKHLVELDKDACVL